MLSHASKAKQSSATQAKSVPATAQRSQAVRNILRAGVQPKLKIGAVNDPAEVEADRVADQVMRMPVPLAAAAPPVTPPPPGDGTAGGHGGTPPPIRRKCTACDDDKVQRKQAKPNHPVIRRRSSGGDVGGAPASAEASTAIKSLGSGSPLPTSERSFFEPRFGRDLSGVRIHTGGTADAASKVINARAFSLGNNIAFANGEYQPGTQSGRSLMAHEITHTLQGGGGIDRLVRRKLRVGPPSDPSDPLVAMDPVARNAMVQQLLDELGGGFRVVPGAPDSEIIRDGADCENSRAVSTGTKPIGSCCLCFLTGPNSSDWLIRIVQHTGAFTSPSRHEINIPASTSPAVSGHWTGSDVRQARPRVITFAHEICGHAVLMDLDSHPGGSRIDGLRHDPTIEMERAIWTEQGLPASELRGLAASPIHRGESFTIIEVIGFPFGSADLATLPPAELAKIGLVATLAGTKWIDIVGHADAPQNTATANAAISLQRAENVRDQLTRVHGVSATVRADANNNTSPRRPTQTVNRIDTQGVGSSQCSSRSGRNSACRKVQIFLAGMPAGAGRPRAGTSLGDRTNNLPDAQNPSALRRNLATGNSCEQLLILTAWPSGPGN